MTFHWQDERRKPFYFKTNHKNLDKLGLPTQITHLPEWTVTFIDNSMIMGLRSYNVVFDDK